MHCKNIFLNKKREGERGERREGGRQEGKEREGDRQNENYPFIVEIH